MTEFSWVRAWREAKGELVDEIGYKPGYWTLRCRRDGPICPAMIIWLETTSEPGNPDNDMTGTRYRHLAGFVSGQSVVLREIGLAKDKAEITAAEHDRLIAEIVRDQRADQYNPRLFPFKPVDRRHVAIPFGRKP